jgi:hypothetical protein
MKKLIPGISIVLLLLLSCGTITENLAISIGEEERAMLLDIETSILQYRFELDNDALLSAEADIQELLEQTIFNEDFLAQLYGLNGLVAYYRSNRIELSRSARQVEENNPNEEFNWILRALLENDIDERLIILQEGVEASYENSRILLLLADTYLESGDFRQAVVYYDEALDKLGEPFTSFYTGNRDLAYEYLSSGESLSGEGFQLAGVGEIQFAQAITLIVVETNILRSRFAENLRTEEIFDRLIDEEFIFNAELTPEDLLLRKDAAYLFFRILVQVQNDRQALIEYGKYYRESLSENERKALEGLSPIDDVEQWEYYFYPIVYLVERELMDLPDGINFKPEGTLSGAEYLDILAKIREYLSLIE